MPWKWRMKQNLKRNLLVSSKLTWGIWREHSKVSKICTLMSFFWTKYIKFDLKKYRGVMFGGIEYWCNIWRKTDLCFQKWHEEFDKFWPKLSKISKICALMGFFLTKCIMFALKKSIWELCLMALNIDATFEVKLTCAFRMTWGI